jgi:hypothetical protein
LEEIVTVLRNHITGDSGMNLLLTLWVDDLIEGATTAIETAGGRVISYSISDFSSHDLNIYILVAPSDPNYRGETPYGR